MQSEPSESDSKLRYWTTLTRDMKNGVSLALIALAPAGLSAAWGEEPSSSPEKPSPQAIVAHNRDVVARTPEADGVFVVQENGSIRHVQSGMVCGARYPSFEFWHVEVSSSGEGKGSDVACDYGRNGRDGRPAATLTVSAVKQADGLALDQAFAVYRAQVLAMYPDAIPSGPALKIKLADTDQDTYGPFEAFRSEEFVRELGGEDWTEDLIVLIRKGWVLKVRKTMPGKPHEFKFTEKTDSDELTNAARDRTVDLEVMMDVALTIGQ
jgi:hypothetical protein